MLVQIVEKFTGYNSDRTFYKVGVDNVDMTAEIEHSYSLGWDEPIYVDGTCKKFGTVTIEVPEWLIEGLQHYHSTDTPDDPTGNKSMALDSAARIVYGDIDYRESARTRLFDTLRTLALCSKPGKFQNSVMEWFKDRGWLSPKQQAAINRPAWKRY